MEAYLTPAYFLLSLPQRSYNVCGPRLIDCNSRRTVLVAIPEIGAVDELRCDFGSITAADG